MTLKKSIAGYFKEVLIRSPLLDINGSIITNENGDAQYTQHLEKIWVPQLDIEVHPLEEAEILASWDMGKMELEAPKPPTQQQELDWLIEFGSEYVKQKRQEYDSETKEYEPLLIQAKKRHEECVNAYKIWQENEGKDYHKGLTEAQMYIAINKRISEINNEVQNRLNEIRSNAQ